MTKIAIKHMTEEQANAESGRIEDRLYELQKQMGALEAKCDRMEIFSDGWLKRLDGIAKRLLEISQGATPNAGEVNQLFANQKKIMDRWQRWLNARWAVYRDEKGRIHREMDALYKRNKHVTKRRWQHNYARLGPTRPDEIRVLWR